MKTAVQFPITFSFEDILALVRRLPRRQQQELVELVSRDEARTHWQDLSERLPDVEINADQIQEEINAHRREQHEN